VSSQVLSIEIIEHANGELTGNVRLNPHYHGPSNLLRAVVGLIENECVKHGGELADLLSREDRRRLVEQFERYARREQKIQGKPDQESRP